MIFFVQMYSFVSVFMQITGATEPPVRQVGDLVHTQLVLGCIRVNESPPQGESGSV